MSFSTLNKNSALLPPFHAGVGLLCLFFSGSYLIFGFEFLTSSKNLILVGILWLLTFLVSLGFIQNWSNPFEIFSKNRKAGALWLITSVTLFVISVQPVLSNIPSLNVLEIHSIQPGDNLDFWDGLHIISIQYTDKDRQNPSDFPLGMVTLGGDCRISGVSILCGKSGNETIKYSEVSTSGFSLLIQGSASGDVYDLTWNGEKEQINTFSRMESQFLVDLPYKFQWNRQSLPRKLIILSLMFSNIICIGLILFVVINLPQILKRTKSMPGQFVPRIARTCKVVISNLGTFRKRIPPWTAILFAVFLSVTVYSFMEWIFFATKPSFMSGLPLLGKIQLWLIANTVVNIPVLAFILLLALAERIGNQKTAELVLKLAAIWFAVFFLGITLLLLVDNFTYTLFSFGIVSTSGFWRVVYGIGFFLLLGILFSNVSVTLQKKQKPTVVRIKRWIMALALGIPLLFTIQSASGNSLSANQADVSGVQKKPNIILLGSDGVSSSHMSLYGYARETTPFLDSIASHSLVMQNHYTNAGKTIGSIASMLTGKLPTATRVIYPPDILKGVDSYQHLPGILRQLGYFNVEIGVPQYLDSSVLNLENGFNRINGVDKDFGEPWKTIRAWLPDNVVYFIDTIVERVTDRLGHILFIRTMTNPYLVVTKTTNVTDDEDRIAELTNLIREEVRPFFVHVHLMGTHGRHFAPKSDKFSRGVEQNQVWMTDFYDDAIVDFDDYIRRVYKMLEESGKLENTILMVITDHGENWAMIDRIPLLIRFPNADHSGKIYVNTQNLDITPTILNYMGISRPDWMVGQSLVDAQLDTFRPIFAASVNEAEDMVRLYDVNAMKPPFFQFGYFSATVCEKWVVYDTRRKQWSSGEVEGYIHPCEIRKSVTNLAAKELIDQLRKDGYDVSSVPEFGER